MAGIRVPDAQYEAPTPTPEQAQVPTPKLPVANANEFGAAQAAAGAEAGAKVQQSSIDIADRMIQMKQWNQQSQMYDDKESYKEFREKSAYDTTQEQVTDPDGTTRMRTVGYMGWTDKNDLAQIPQRVKDLQDQGMETYGPQKGETLLSVAKQYSRYFSGIDGIYYNQATKKMVDQTNQNTVADYQSAFGKAMQTTSPYSSFLNYHDNLNDIAFHKNAGTSVATGVPLSPKEMQGLLKNNFETSGKKFYQDKIWSGAMTVEQANEDLDKSVAAMPKEAVGDVDEIKKEIGVQSDAYQTQVKKQGEIQMKDNTNKGVAMVGAGLINAKNVSTLATMGMDSKVVEPLTNAIINVESKVKDTASAGFFGIGSKPADKTVPIAEENLGIDLEGNENKEAKQAADYTIQMANSLTHAQAADVLVKAINNGNLDKEQLNVYTRTLALVGQFLPTETEAAQGKPIDPKGVAQVSSVSDLGQFGINANLPDLSHLKQHLDNLDNKMDPKESMDSVKKNTMNRMYPQTVGTGTVPSMIVGRDYSKRLFMGREADSSGYPFIYDEATKRVIPNKDYNKAQ